ncbi:MAG: PAS domain S-box protein [Desulfobulbaceae bacterium]|nr:PAS domain S-box protein [Desulfobulbaceae bacterium]
MRVKLFIPVLILLAFLACVAHPPILASGAEPVKIGVLSFRPKPQTLAQWQPLAVALKQALPKYDFVVEALTYPELNQAVAARQLDFVLTNSGHYVMLARRSGLSSPLATLSVNANGLAITVFGGVIFSRAGQANINTLHDIKGKSIAAIDAESLGGYQMQAYELSRVGIRMAQDVKLIPTGMPHDKAVETVLAGHADVGFVRSGVLEGMEREGKLDIKQLKILNRQNLPDFPFQLSTRLYPEWPFASLPHIDENLARHIAAALFVLEDNTAATRAMGIHGFTVPADYTPVEELLRELRMPPFDVAPPFTLQDIWTRYRWQLMGSLFVVGVILFLGVSLLLTHRRLAAKHHFMLLQQQKLQESEEKFRTVADHTLGWEYWEGPQHEMIYMNPSCEGITGYSRAEFMAAPDLLMRVIHPDDRQQSEVHRHDISNQEDGMLDFRIVRRDGGIRWIEHICHPVWSNDGVFNGRRISNRDITERKQAEKRLRESEKKYRLLFDSAGDAIFIHDEEGGMLEVNQRAVEQYGYNHAELMALTIDRVDSPTESHYAPQRIARLMEQGHLTFETVHQRKDGSPIQTEVNARRLIWNGKPAMMSICRDITERKQADEARRQLSEIIERSLNEIYLFDWETLQFKHANQGALKNLHYTLEELKALTAVAINPQFTETSFRTMIQPLLADEQETLVYETVHRRADGTLYPVEVHLQLVGTGEQRTFLAVIFDITERNKLEAEKAKLEFQYHQLQKNESLGRMAGAIAHNFNNMLGAVIGNLEIGMDALPPDSQPSKCMTQAMKAARRAAEVSGLMLTYLGQTPGKKELLDLSEACRRCLPMLRDAMPKEVNFEVDLPSPGPTIKANALQIQQVLTNLATNAWEALAEGLGAIHLVVKTVSPADIPATHRFPLEWQPQDDLYACLEVTDTGSGIAEKVIDTLFDPFFTTKFTGRGLGLPVVLGIVGAHHGAITVESEAERGSVFQVFFPISS